MIWKREKEVVSQFLNEALCFGTCVVIIGPKIVVWTRLSIESGQFLCAVEIERE